MAGSVDELASRLVAGGKNITRANREGVGEAVKAGVVVAQAAVVAATGDSRLSGMKKAKLGAFGKVFGYMNPVGIVAYRGPVHIVNNPVAPHEILPRTRQRTAKGNARRGGKALSPAGNPWARASVQHPGTKGKNFHEKVERVVIAQSDRIIKSTVRGHLARTFAGR